MQRQAYLPGDASDTKMQGILESLVQGRCKVSNLPVIFTKLNDHQHNSLSLHQGGTNFCVYTHTHTLYQQRDRVELLTSSSVP